MVKKRLNVGRVSNLSRGLNDPIAWLKGRDDYRKGIASTWLSVPEVKSKHMVVTSVDCVGCIINTRKAEIQGPAAGRSKHQAQQPITRGLISHSTPNIVQAFAPSH